MSQRFDLPAIGPAVPIVFPRPTKALLPSGLNVRAIHWPAAPVVSIALLVPGGAASDPPDRPGLMGIVADMLDEGAGPRDTIELAEAFARLGTHLDIDITPDATTIGLTTLSRNLTPALELMGDVLIRPHLDQAGLDRVRELRASRLQQLRRSPAAPADRALLRAVFGDHPYGHGVLGTTRSLEAITLDEVRERWATTFTVSGATLIIAGDVAPDFAGDTATALFSTDSARRRTGLRSEGYGDPDLVRPNLPKTASSPSFYFVDRPDAPQSEVRVGQPGPSRQTPDYHALVTLNALLGGQFTSRINRNLRETRGITYGARSAFDFRRMAGSFECDASVQSDATADAVREILREIRDVRREGAIEPAELSQSKASLTRGYARGFETARQLVRSAAHLALHDLHDDTFDRFVPVVEQLTAADLSDAAARHLDESQCSIVVVGDSKHRASLEEFGAVELIEPEF